MIERHIKGGQKTIAYKQLGLSMDIETTVVQHVSSPKESNFDNLKPYTPIPSLKTLFSLLQCHVLTMVLSLGATRDEFLITTATRLCSVRISNEMWL